MASVAAFSGTATAAEATGSTSTANPSSTATTQGGNQAPVPCAADQLIAAIVRANANGGAQLTLTPRCTYTLTTNQGADGLPIITQPITINGQDATITRAASATNFRILNVGVGGRLTLNNLTITGGFAPDSPGGGGILVQAGGRATLYDTTVTHNQSTTNGGGIANYGIAAVLGDGHGGGKVANNSTPVSGGGIYNQGQLSTKDIEVSDNTSDIEGGGITDRGTAVLEQTRIVDNFADSSGGGLTTVAAVTKLTASTVSDNTADGDGGGIECVSSTIYVSSTKVDHNTATDDGGGIFNQSVPAPLGGSAFAVVEDSEVDGNTASGDGGGINNGSANLVVRRSHVSLNQAIGTASRGGGIFDFAGALTLTAAEITENSSAVAGGVFNSTNRITVDQKSVIVANRPTNCTGSTVAVPNCFG
ncbi:right-handed parallel beta-helix repeat-containing protein [Rugosimonospora africana]|nr:right-handed parallel beta-helix repeat-containing protein [Rugosimonospora africana]